VCPNARCGKVFFGKEKVCSRCIFAFTSMLLKEGAYSPPPTATLARLPRKAKAGRWTTQA
jgi:hypothetical protein